MSRAFGAPCTSSKLALPARAALRAPCGTWLHANSRHRLVTRVQALSPEDKEAPAAVPEQEAVLPPAPSTSSSSDAPHLPYAAIAGVAGLGAVETAYLTWVKLFGGELVCPTSGCDAVLSSAYAWLFGIPLSAFGFLAYSAVAGLAVAGLAQPQLAEGPKGATVRAGLTVGAAAMASVSAVLIYILQTQFPGEPCAWCYLSAGLSTALLVLVLRGLSLRQLQDVAGPSLGVAASTVLALAVSFGSVNQSNADVGEDFYLPFLPPVITTQASDETRQLARQLSTAGAKMYGAFWCSHCFEQKQAFGVQAMADFPYVECYPQGWRRGTQLDKACADAGIRAFPTWQINGQLIEGELTLDEVARLVAGADPATAMRPSQ